VSDELNYKFWLVLVAVVSILCVCVSGLSGLGGLVAGLQGSGIGALSLLLLGFMLFLGALLGAGGFLYLGHRFAFWTIANPFQKNLCPYCFNRFYIGDCEIVSSFNPAVQIDPPPKGFRRTLGRLLVPALVRERYAKEHAARKCPFCSYLLPSNLEYMDNQIIALVGGVSSGKSLYIASLIKQFEKDQVRERIGCVRFKALDDEIDKRYEDDYYKPLFVQKVIFPLGVKPNPGQYVKPLTYVMEFRRNGRTKRVNLMLFDGAGEGIEDQRIVAQVFRYTTNASAIIFMVDPMALPSFVQQLPPHLRNPTAGKDPWKVLEALIEQIKLEKGAIRGTEMLNIPIAITLSKSDLFKYLDPKSPPTFLQDHSYKQGFDQDDFRTVNDEVKALINRFDGIAILQAAEVFRDKAFLAVSATGYPDEGGKFRNVRPCRTADPLLWALWRLGMIDTM
jgi:GTPase SAR1 family protein